MYSYIVDPLADSEQLDKIESILRKTIIDLDIDGEFTKIIGDGDASKVIRMSLDKGIDNIIIIGSDRTLNQASETISKYSEKSVNLGIIPLGDNNHLADDLGIGSWEEACYVIKDNHRRPIGLIKYNDKVVLYRALVHHPGTAEEPGLSVPFNYNLIIDDNYKIEGKASYIEVVNSQITNPKLSNKALALIHPVESNDDRPRKGIFKFLSKDTDQEISQLPFESMKMFSHRKLSVDSGGDKQMSESISFELSERKINLFTPTETS